MNSRTFGFFHSLLVLLVAGFVLTGCRTYGGYGSEEAAVHEIGQANERFAAELERARSDAERLQSLVARHETLAPFVAEYEQWVAEHAALLEAHKEKYEQLSGGASYRKVSRALGAVVSEQQLVHEGYREVLEDMLGMRDRLVKRALSVHYQQVPVYYRRIEEQIYNPTVSQVLAAFGE